MKKTAALLVPLSLFLTAAAHAQNAVVPNPVAVLQSIVSTTPRLDQLSVQMATIQRRIDRMQADIDKLNAGVTLHAKMIASLTNAQKDLAALRGQLGQVESALVKHSAWLAQQKLNTDALSNTANEALQRAMSAGKLKEGRLLQETVLAEELTQFKPYQADLGEDAKTAILALAEKLKAENDDIYLEIQGHSDTSGRKAQNQQLSQQRADAVRDFLHRTAGIPMHRMAAVAYGDSAPVADNASKEGRAKNRRVTLVVLK
jgi:outer membrane protein OmpA-like peptidoglycan-associated protein